jgi:hypothetical protein
MTNTLPAQLDLESYDHFRTSLAEPDQHLLDDLLQASIRFQQAVNESGPQMAYPVALLAMLLETRREILRLRQAVASV